MMKLASTLAISSSLIVAIVSLASGASVVSIFIRAAVTLLGFTFLALIMYRITLPASPDAAGPSPETPAADSTRGTRIDLLAGDEQ